MRMFLPGNTSIFLLLSEASCTCRLVGWSVALPESIYKAQIEQQTKENIGKPGNVVGKRCKRDIHRLSIALADAEPHYVANVHPRCHRTRSYEVVPCLMIWLESVTVHKLESCGKSPAETPFSLSFWRVCTPELSQLIEVMGRKKSISKIWKEDCLDAYITCLDSIDLSWYGESFKNSGDTHGFLSPPATGDGENYAYRRLHLLVL